MAAVTYETAAPAVSAPAKPAIASKSVWLRLWDGFVEARMQQAMREVALHRHLLPADLERAATRGSAKINP